MSDGWWCQETGMVMAGKSVGLWRVEGRGRRRAVVGQWVPWRLLRKLDAGAIAGEQKVGGRSCINILVDGLQEVAVACP